MKMIPVISSTISHIGHDPATKRMSIAFKSGKTYEYGNVSADQFSSLANADSIGKHFHQHIRGNDAHTIQDFKA